MQGARRGPGEDPEPSGPENGWSSDVQSEDAQRARCRQANERGLCLLGWNKALLHVSDRFLLACYFLIYTVFYRRAYAYLYVPNIPNCARYIRRNHFKRSCVFTCKYGYCGSHKPESNFNNFLSNRDLPMCEKKLHFKKREWNCLKGKYETVSIYKFGFKDTSRDTVGEP